jgi:DNA-binding SARP family transcriptional activator
VRFGVLGPLEVAHVDGLGSRNLRTLLASLLLRPNRPVATADLTERLWAGEPPRAPLRVLQTNVVRLRHLLGREVIRTTPGGYRIAVDTEDLDLLRFERLLAAAAGAEPVRETAILRSALDLWRGPVVADVESRAIQAYDVPAIAERRLAALERRIELDVLHGDDSGLVPELRALVADHPSRERLWKWLMVVLSRQGRQADALDAYRTLAHRLVGELGIEPGTQLREVHQRILRGVDPAPAPPPTVVTARSVPRQLPADDPHLVGRAGAFAALTAAVGVRPPAVVVDGPAGIGKTALAVRWSTGVADDFPGGQLYVNLRGFDPAPPLTPLAALRLLLDGLSAPTVPHDVDAAGNLFRTLTAGRRVLVLLDNARDAEQVRPLLPGAGSLTVVTSRDQMRGLVARDGARRVTLGPLDGADAARIAAAVAAGGFPLALRIAAERAARLPLAPVEELPDELRTALSWSYAALDPETARVFRMLGHGDVDSDVDPRRLDRLVEVHLVEQDSTGRYRLHDPVRAFAAQLSAAPALALGA